MKKLGFLLFSFLLAANCILAQQYPDRHNTTLENSWVSCTATMNPNTDRGLTHWIMYDLGTTYALHESVFWNLNAYEYTDDGIQDMMIDYSIDGLEWDTFGRYSISKAEASSTYEGEAGPDFGGLTARYILITANTNYGGNCYGFSEFRVNASPVTISSAETIDLDIQIAASPNPFSDETTITLSDIQEYDDLMYQVTDASGRVLVIKPVTQRQISLEAVDFPSGILQFSLLHADGIKSIQINHIK